MPENNSAFEMLEPHWNGLRAWAQVGLKTSKSPKQKKLFQEVLDQCEQAKRAGRPNTDWED